MRAPAEGKCDSLMGDLAAIRRRSKRIKAREQSSFDNLPDAEGKGDSLMGYLAAGEAIQRGSKRRRTPMGDLAAGEAIPRRSERIKATKQSSIDNLPDALLWEILVELPNSRSAVQCKLVCKRWLSLISDPHFFHISIHRHHRYARVDFMLHSYDFSGRSVRSFVPILEPSNHLLKIVPCFREQDRLHPLSAVAYCSDLLLYSNCVCLHRDFYICNSFTKQWLALPPVTSVHWMVPVGLVCYPDYCGDDIKQACYPRYNYKVVRFITPLNDSKTNYKFNVEIFSSQTRQWKNWEVLSPSPVSSSISSMFFYHPIVTYNGILHLVNPKLNIVAYDPLNNVKQCRIIDPPPYFNHDSFNSLGVCRGRLRLSRKTFLPPMDHHHHHYRQLFSVWELEDYNSGKWRLVHETDIHDMVSNDHLLANVKISSHFFILAFHPFDVDIVFFQLDTRIVSYNMRNKMLTLVTQLQGDAATSYYKPYLQLYPLVHPCLPTPVPPLPADALPC